jgi:hypothetical protein
VPRPRFTLRTVLVFTALVGYFIVTGPYWYKIARIHYREHRIRVITHELSATHRNELHQELGDWYADRDMNPPSGM